MTAINALIEQYELVKEVHYIFDNVEPKIRGRIYKVILGPDTKYMWVLNYYNRLAHEAGIYTPSAPFGDDLNEIENKLTKYAKRFEKAVEWLKNDTF